MTIKEEELESQREICGVCKTAGNSRLILAESRKIEHRSIATKSKQIVKQTTDLQQQVVGCGKSGLVSPVN